MSIKSYRAKIDGGTEEIKVSEIGLEKAKDKTIEKDAEKAEVIEEDLTKASGPRLGKPYDQQPGRRPGEGAGHIVSNMGLRDDNDFNKSKNVLIPKKIIDRNGVLRTVYVLAFNNEDVKKKTKVLELREKILSRLYDTRKFGEEIDNKKDFIETFDTNKKLKLNLRNIDKIFNISKELHDKEMFANQEHYYSHLNKKAMQMASEIEKQNEIYNTKKYGSKDILNITEESDIQTFRNIKDFRQIARQIITAADIDKWEEKLKQIDSSRNNYLLFLLAELNSRFFDKENEEEEELGNNGEPIIQYNEDDSRLVDRDFEKAFTKYPKYLTREKNPKTGKWEYKYTTTTETVKHWKDQLHKASQLDAQIKKFKEKIKQLDIVKKDYMAELLPVFDELENAGRISIEDAGKVNEIMKTDSTLTEYAKVYADAYIKLNDEAKKLLIGLKTQYTQIITKYSIKEKEISKTQDSTASIGKLKEGLKKLLDLRKQMNAILKKIVNVSKIQEKSFKFPTLSKTQKLSTGKIITNRTELEEEEDDEEEENTEKSAKEDADAIAANITDETKAIAFYDDVTDKTDNPKLKKLFNHIKGEEKGHKKELEDALKGDIEVKKSLKFPVQKSRTPGAKDKEKRKQKGVFHEKEANKLFGQAEHEKNPQRKRDLEKKAQNHRDIAENNLIAGHNDFDKSRIIGAKDRQPRKQRGTRSLQNKMRQLIDSYKKEVVTSGYKEDMGRKYERKFKDYIGDEYSYTYGDRLYNNDLQNHLTHVVSGPVEKADGAGMTTTDGGAGVITPGMGSYPKRRKKRARRARIELMKAVQKKDIKLIKSLREEIQSLEKSKGSWKKKSRVIKCRKSR